MKVRLITSARIICGVNIDNTLEGDKVRVTLAECE